MQPLVSVCIPAYKRIEFLQRLLDSLVTQSFKAFEVVVTDDSNDQSVQQLLQQYEQKLFIDYYKNVKPLGTPENWNASVRRAKGQWIKLMHDDDWFNDEDALQKFVHETG